MGLDLVGQHDRHRPDLPALLRPKTADQGRNLPDFVARGTHPFYTLVNNGGTSASKAYLTIAANIGDFSMRVEKFAVNSAWNPTNRSYSAVWRKRVAITGGIFLDRAQALPQPPV